MKRPAEKNEKAPLSNKRRIKQAKKVIRAAVLYPVNTVIHWIILAGSKKVSTVHDKETDSE